MTIEEQLAMSFYEEIGMLNKEHHISIVQHRSSKKVFLKKQLSVYNKSVYQHLFYHPVPYMPKICEMYEEDGILTLIEEYISGNTLEDLLKENGPFSTERAVLFFFKLCDIVSNLHKRTIPVIHRDIKPSNIIITPSDSLYLLDMNAAKFVSRDKSEDTQLLGTHGYAAPEQYGIGGSSSDEHTDIYALGMILKLLLSGDPNKLPDHHPLEAVIKKATMLDPSLRYPNVESLKDDIKQIIKPGIGQENNKRERLNHTFYPPGFRNGKISHAIIAIPIYAILIYSVLTLEVKDASFGVLMFERFCLALCCLFVVAITGNYLHVQDRIPYVNQPNKYIKVLLITAINFLGVVAIVFVMVTIENLLHLI